MKIYRVYYHENCSHPDPDWDWGFYLHRSKAEKELEDHANLYIEEIEVIE